MKAYDEDGRADLYLNYIIGAVQRYYDYPQLQSYFRDLKQYDYENHEIYEDLLWTGLENCAFLRGKDERPVLSNLRRSYAKRFLGRFGAAGTDDALGAKYILDQVKIVHFRKALGETPKMSAMVAKLLADLEFDAGMNTEEIMLRMDRIIRDYFKAGFIPRRRGLKKQKKHRAPFFMKLFRRRIVDSSIGMEPDEKDEGVTGANLSWVSSENRKQKSYRKYIEEHYGAPILTEEKTLALEQKLCYGNHENCHLYFTRGEFDTVADNSGAVALRKNDALRQRELNKNFYLENTAKNKSSIAKLTNIIRNAILLDLEDSTSRALAGKLEAGRVWRNVLVNDNRIFSRKLKDLALDLSVDIMLDASASQDNRQAVIAAEAYIIAESLTRCSIPVRVFSFCSEKFHTVINLFRDYGEVGGNDRIFNYFSAGCNRDGLAVRTAVHMIRDTPYEHKLLIVLSDGLPYDPQGVYVRNVSRDYGGAAAVSDTAQEVRKGWQDGISIYCVFTGSDSSIPDAQKIYGHNLAYIKSQTRFADIVGVLLQNELKSF
ncbi:hypothetical protein SDC9_54492 [bioreactor metagenome]|uniref:VWFA domain-containing protein n=1 Tax=bioreactor metagenome TaxID=1076179 RepID=A0A644WWA6_9ZZZZ